MANNINSPAQSIYTLLNIIHSIANDNINTNLKIQQNALALTSHQTNLLVIRKDSTNLLGFNIDTKLQTTKNHPITHSKLTNFESFLHAIKGSIVRLNHCGVGYSCSNIDKEVDFYKQLVADTNYHLYEEPSDTPYARWLFIGNVSNWEDSLFEIVLTQSLKPKLDNWFPHFQIDIDTTLEPTELLKISDNYLGMNFFNWKLDVTDYGVVLCMGKLTEIDGVNMYVGVGTSLRNTKMHREQNLALRS